MAGIAHRHEPVANQRSTLAVHELHVAGPAGGDHRLAAQHRLSRHQAETLGTMQRQHDVAGIQQCGIVLGRQHARLDADIRYSRRCSGDDGEVAWEVVGVANLQQQHAILPVAECGAEGRDRRQRVLSLEGGRKVERHQHDYGRVRQAERGPTECRLCNGQRTQRRRDDAHPARCDRCHRGGGELRRHPDLVHEAQSHPPFRRHARQLPRPIADNAPAPQQGPRQLQQRAGQRRRIHMHDERRASRRQITRRRRHIQRPACHAETSQAAQHQPCACTQAGGLVKPAHHGQTMQNR